jgi:hypothetical protein
VTLDTNKCFSTSNELNGFKGTPNRAAFLNFFSGGVVVGFKEADKAAFLNSFTAQT